MKVIFMGTPEFAVTILDKLVQEKINIVGVVTSLDKPAGRGQKIKTSAVKEYALKKKLTILQPKNLKENDFLSTLKSLEADLQVVVAFRMLPKVVWNMPQFGTINLHASLLPQYRGAAPINWVIINGEKKTGVTTFFIEQEIDTGAIIDQETINIEEQDTAGTIHNKLMYLGAELTHKSILRIKNGTANKILQKDIIKDKQEIKNAPKIFKQDCLINFEASSKNIVNKIKGLSPYPTAWFKIINIKTKNTKSCKIFYAKITKKSNLKKGELLIENQKMYIGTNENNIEILELQLEGKKRMPLQSLLNGFDFNNWKVDN